MLLRVLKAKCYGYSEVEETTFSLDLILFFKYKIDT